MKRRLNAFLSLQDIRTSIGFNFQVRIMLCTVAHNISYLLYNYNAFVSFLMHLHCNFNI